MARKARTAVEPSEAELSQEELESQEGEELPDREAMSILPIPDPNPPVLFDELNQRPI